MTNSLTIAAVQFRPEAGAVQANLLGHVRAVREAAGAGLVVFPELSLTGYEPRLAKALAMDASDPVLEPLQAVADELGVVVAAGLPLRAGDGVRIGMVVFTPGRPRAAYAKRHLHADELPWFVPGDAPLVLEVAGKRVVPAICYESMLPEVAAEAKAAGAEVFLASVAKHAAGVARAEIHFADVATRHGMAVVMANAVGPCDDFVAAGGSAAWNSRGERVAGLGGDAAGTVFYET